MQTFLSSIKQRGEKKTTLQVKSNPEEGFEQKQRDPSSFSFSSSLKLDGESPIRATGLQNGFNGKESSHTTVSTDNTE